LFSLHKNLEELNAAKSSFEFGRDGGDIMFDSFRSTFSLL